MSKDKLSKIAAVTLASTYVAGTVLLPSAGQIKDVQYKTLLTKASKTDVSSKNSNTELDSVQTGTATNKLENSSIVMFNGWRTNAGSIKFNTDTMSLYVSGYNRFIGKNTNNNFLNVELYNPTKGEITYSNSFAGNLNTSQLASKINGTKFEYGDIIGISFDSSQGRVDVDNSTSNQMNTNGSIKYFKITKQGIVPSSLSPIKVNNFDILGKSTGSVTEGVLTGKSAPNEIVTAIVGNNKFTARADASGNYSISLKDTNGFTEQTKIKIFAKNEGISIVSPTIAEGINVQNSKLEIIDAWNNPSAGIIFNPITMEMNTYKNYGKLYLKGNVNINIYSNKTGKTLESAAITPSTSQEQFEDTFNNKAFEYGNIITISSSRANNVKIQNGSDISSLGTKTVSYEITKDGLVPYTAALTVNPLKILGNGNITSTTLTGKAGANENVSAIVNEQTFTAKSDANGNYSINIKDEKGFTENTQIKVFASGEGVKTIEPTLASEINIQNTKVEVVNQWGNPSAGITFNPISMKMSTYKNYWSLYLSGSTKMSINIYSNISGKILESEDISSQTSQADFANMFNGKTFAYGDIVELTTSRNGSLRVVNGEKTNDVSTTKTQMYQLTKEGLVPYTPSIIVNPLNILGNGKITKAVVTGKAKPNKNVIATVDGKTFNSKSDASGNYSINISDTNGFTISTKVSVFGENQGSVTVLPTMSSDVKIQNNQISISNVWGQYIGTVKFNPITEKMEFVKGWAVINPYVNSKNEVFGIMLYNANGTLLNQVKVYGSQYSETALSNLFNNISYNYGDTIRIDYKSSSRIYVSNFNNSSSYRVSGDEQFKIEKGGLVKGNLSEMNVNPFEILGATNTAPTSGTLTGKTIKPNSEVTAKIGEKIFTATSNASGEFSIPLTDEGGFTNKTKIYVSTNGELTKVINPSAIKNLGLSNTKLQLNDNSLGIAQTMTFNPATMTISNSGNSFAAQLINPSNGKVISSLATGNFNVFKSNNDLNGSTFKYGDIISVYESEETYLSDHNIMLMNGKEKTNIDAVGKFASYEITANGLVPLSNNYLKDVSAIYKGNSVVTVNATTTPNTKATLYYGDNKSVEVTSNAKGLITAELPVKDATIGSEVRVYVNNQNTENVIVKYDSKIFNTNSSIQIVNNEAFPVINMTFSPATQTINSMVYPRDKTYAGIFYGNKMNISIIDPQSGVVLKSVTSNKPQEIQDFSNELNNYKYKTGDIIKISYDNNLVSVNVNNDKKAIGNATGSAEYFEITNEGLVNISNKFVKVNPLEILGNGKVTKAVITGSAKAGESVSATINGVTYKGTANSKGEFSINIEDASGFTNATAIIVSASGYIPTIINPTTSSKLQIANSYLNFYQNTLNWETSGLTSSIGFNTSNNTFFVNNYFDTFGTGSENYFTLSLYNSDGSAIASKTFTGESTSDLSDFINGKSFTYGEIIGLKYDASAYKPVVVNGSNVSGNISGAMEYFKITKDGLVRVNFGNKAETTNVSWSNGNLNISASIADGNTQDLINANKKLVLINNSGKVVASESASTKVNNGVGVVSGSFTSLDLSEVKAGETYKVGLLINGSTMPIYVGTNAQSSNDFVLSGSSVNQLSISKKAQPYVTIKNSSDISSYLNNIESSITNTVSSNINLNAETTNKVLAAEFINRIGASNLESFYKESTQNANFLNWILNNSTAMSEFLSGPNPDGRTPEGQPRATYSACLQVWSNIWSTYTNSHNGFNLKLAIAVSLTNGGKIASFPSGKWVGSPVERYNIFETLNANGGMLPEFSTYDVSHLCFVTNTIIANDQILKMRNIILQNHNGLIKAGLLNDIAYTIHYNVNNPHTGASVFGPNFYGKNPTIKTVWYDGGVCGATGRMGASGEQVFGIAAVQTPQPGHNAFIYYNSKTNTWNIGNMVDGWAHTYDADMSGWSNLISPNNNGVASYNILYQAADTSTLKESNLYVYLASTVSTYTEKMDALNKAIQINKLNLGAWIALVNFYKSNPNTTIEQYNTLMSNIESTFKDYPMPMYNLLYQLKSVYTNSGSQYDFDNYVASVQGALTKASESSPQKSVAKVMLSNMASDGLVKGNVIINGSINIKNVWQGQIASITLNGTNKEIEVLPSGSYTNPYGWGEAFEISLENASGQVIKSIVINHQVAHPGAEIEKVFNNQQFEYGDKIVINYINSSNITASDLITESGVVNNYRVKSGVNTFYITKNGLSLTQSGLANMAVVPVTTKDIDGKTLGSAINLKGQLSKQIIDNSLEIPTGYELSSVLFNGKTIYTGNNLEDAKYAIAQEKYANSSNIEIIVKSKYAINASVLKYELNRANEKLNSGVLYTIDSLNNLNKEINLAKNMLTNTSATLMQVDGCANNLANAIDNLKVWTNAKAELTSKINDASSLLNSSEVKNSIINVDSLTQALQTEITNAVKVEDNNKATSAEIMSAINNITTPYNKLKSVASMNGSIEVLNNDNGTATVTFTNKTNTAKLVTLYASNNEYKAENMLTDHKGFWFANINTPKQGESVTYYFMIDGKYKTKLQTYELNNTVTSFVKTKNTSKVNSNKITTLPMVGLTK